MDEKLRLVADTREDRALTNLRQIASLLGWPVSAFFDAAGSNSASETAQLLELWSEIKEPHERQRVLKFIGALKRSDPAAT